MANNNIEIDGTRLRMLITQQGFQQKEVAERAGISTYRLSHIARSNKQISVKESTAQALANVLDVDINELTGEVAEERDKLSEGEKEVLRLYRSLSPIEQAEALLWINEQVSGYGENNNEDTAGNNMDQSE